MTHPRDWSNRAWSLAFVALLVLLVVANQLDIGAPPKDMLDAVVKFSPAAAVIVALGSLLVTAWSTFALGRRQKRQATIEAWTAWSDKTVAERRVLTAHLGPDKITATQARAMVERGSLVGRDGTVLTSDQREEVVDSIVQILNGLERLAAGANQGVFEGTTIQKLGATIIVRAYERFEPYIDLRREISDKKLRQTRAYSNLVELVASLRRHQLDNERLQNLSQVT